MSSTQTIQLSTVLDRIAIQEAISCYARGVDRNDPELMRAAFHADAQLTMGTSKSLQTVDQFVAGIQAGWERFRAWGMHHTMNQHIELDGTVAHAETYYLALMRLKPGCEPPAFFPRDASANPALLWMMGGRYFDRLEQREDDWRIAFRLGSVEYLASSDATATKSMLEMIGDIARRDRSDPTYERPLQR
jgi:hypothetical protein